jgi:hypothetical protein
MANRVGSSQTGTPSQIVSFSGTYSDNEPESIIQACTHRALHYSGSTHVEPRIACGCGKSSGNGLEPPGGYSSPSLTAKNVKPMSTSRSNSGAQLTSLSPFDWVCKPQKRDVSISQRDNDEDLNIPTFSCMKDLSHLEHISLLEGLYHLGPKAFTMKNFRHLCLTDDALGHWFAQTALPTSKKVREVVEKLRAIKIPGRK